MSLASGGRSGNLGKENGWRSGKAGARQQRGNGSEKSISHGGLLYPQYSVSGAGRLNKSF
jgi:hypothetical protein